MRRMITTHAALLLSLVTVVVYYALYISLGTDPAKLTVDALILGEGVVIVMTWWSAAWAAIRRGAQTGEDKVILTIWLAWLTLLISRAYTIWFVLSGRPDWLRDSPVGGTISTLILIAGGYAIFAPITSGQVVPKPVLINIIIAAVAGAFAAGFMIAAYVFGGIRF